MLGAQGSYTGNVNDNSTGGMNQPHWQQGVAPVKLMWYNGGPMPDKYDYLSPNYGKSALAEGCLVSSLLLRFTVSRASRISSLDLRRSLERCGGHLRAHRVKKDTRMAWHRVMGQMIVQ